jgi:Fe2+ transport system protein FeoA
MLNLHIFRNDTALRSTKLPAAGRPVTLAQAASGQTVTITGFGRLAAAQRQHLQAYGLTPGRSVRVLAQRPVTIILVEQTELAFETEIAREVMVE